MSPPAKATNSALSTRWFRQAKRLPPRSAGPRPSARTARCRSAPPSRRSRRALRSRWSRRWRSNATIPRSRRWRRRRIISRGRRRFPKNARRSGWGSNFTVMAGLVPAMTFYSSTNNDVDGRGKAGHDGDGMLRSPFALQLPLIRRIVRLIDRELVHRGLPQMIGEPGRLQVEFAFRDTIGERAVELGERALLTQQSRQPLGFRGIAALLQRQLARHQIERVDRDPQLERVMPADDRRDIVAQEIRNRLDQFFRCRFVLHVTFLAVPAAATDRSRSPTSGVRSSRARRNARVRCENAASCRSESHPTAACPPLPGTSRGQGRRGGPPPHIRQTAPRAIRNRRRVYQFLRNARNSRRSTPDLPWCPRGARAPSPAPPAHRRRR